jgi:hypothetical protein
MNEIIDVIDYLHGTNPDDKIEELYKFFYRYGVSILSAVKHMQNKYENLSKEIPTDSLLTDSLLKMIATRTYLQSSYSNRILEIDEYLRKTIPIMFQRRNQKVKMI